MLRTQTITTSHEHKHKHVWQSNVVLRLLCCHGNHQNVLENPNLNLYHCIFLLPSLGFTAATFLMPRNFQCSLACYSLMLPAVTFIIMSLYSEWVYYLRWVYSRDFPRNAKFHYIRLSLWEWYLAKKCNLHISEHTFPKHKLFFHHQLSFSSVWEVSQKNNLDYAR